MAPTVLKSSGIKDCPQFGLPQSVTENLDEFLNVNVPIHGPDESNQSCTPILVDVEVQKDSLVA